MKLALVPLNATAVAPVKLVPLIVTLVPTAPLVGEKLVIAGPLVTVNALVLVAVPCGVVTLSGPVVAPAGTVAWIEVAEQEAGHAVPDRLSELLLSGPGNDAAARAVVEEVRETVFPYHGLTP